MRMRQFDNPATPKFAYLKYYRVVHFYYRLKYGLSSTDLDMLIFLHAESYFTNKDIQEYYNLVQWDNQRFQRLRKEGWIDTFPRVTPTTRVAHRLSLRGKRMVGEIYANLAGKDFPITPASNPLLKKNIRYTDKVHRIAIREMRMWIKKQVKEKYPQLERKKVIMERNKLKREAEKLKGDGEANHMSVD